MTGVERYVAAAVLVAIRLSGLMVFAPMLNSSAIPPRIKTAFVLAMTLLLAPVVGLVHGSNLEINLPSVIGELGIGLVFGLCLMMLTESLLMAGTLMGMSFSFSLVNLMDPNSMVETPVLAEILNWMGILVIIASGFDRTMLAALVRTFVLVPPGTAVIRATTGTALVGLAGGIFIAGLQLAAPVMAAALVVEMTVSMVSRLAPMLPVQVVGIPLKTLTSFAVLIGSLAVWPGWIERHFNGLLEAGANLLVRP
jgi:flagellar biosynthetic protein FliR